MWRGDLRFLRRANTVTSNMDTSLQLLAALSIGFALGIILMGFFLIRLVLSHARTLKQARAQSVKQSAATRRGQIAEELAPMLPGFDYDPADCKFLGDPVDYVIFDGLSAARNGDGDLRLLNIVFLDVKSGNATLSKPQRAIRAAITARNVTFVTAKITDGFAVELTTAKE